MSSDHGAAPSRCEIWYGCRGEGWRWDLCDSGSGRQVYCDCQAGLELRARDRGGVRADAQ